MKERVRDLGEERVVLGGGAVVLERDLRITVRDGIMLAADVYRPASVGPVPAILEQVPYRKDDVAAVRDRLLGRALAERGFALVRVDVRGTGRSEGLAVDEYTEAEQEDGAETVAWLAEQDWCTGAVGAYGVSYGGFAALQLAARRPPGLGAIAAVYATDDRYTDDVHFYGGALCALELVHYPLRMLAMNALPPRPPLDEPGRAAWLERIEDTPPWVLRWLAEQRDGPYWRNGSLRPEYERIACPTLLVGGWRDGYVNAAVRMAERVEAPSSLVVGPWPHVRPHMAEVPPSVDLVGLLASWFGRHLRGDPPEEDEDAGALVFVQSFDDPRRVPKRISGAWRRFRRWPKEAGDVARFYLHPSGAFTDAPGSSADLLVEHAPHAGTQTGIWCPPPPPHGLPGDQRLDEVHALAFTTEPLDEELVLLGFPRLRVRVAHPGPTALLSAKLADVDSHGRSQLVTRGVLNLSHRGSHEEPAPLPPSEWTPVEVELNATAWRFAPGHRLRLALASSDWPTVWPAPTSERLRVHVGEDAFVELPLAPPGESAVVSSAPPPADEPTVSTGSPASSWRSVRDGLARRAGIETTWDLAYAVSDTKTSVRETRRFSAMVSETDPLDVVVEGVIAFDVSRPDVVARASASARFTCSDSEFRAELSLEVEADGLPFAGRAWDERIPRDLV
jgi:putative CocE/NonD family hydrolase